MRRFNIVKVVIGISMAVLAISPSVMATDEYSGRDYPQFHDGVPAITLSRIDETNNQLEFIVDTRYMGNRKPTRLSAGLPLDYDDSGFELLAHENVDDSNSIRVLNIDWNEALAYRTSSGIYDVYIFNPEVNLGDDVIHKMFYVVDFADGTKWINLAIYDACANWKDGNSCNVLYYDGTREYATAIYRLTKAPAKFDVPLWEPKVSDGEEELETEEKLENEGELGTEEELETSEEESETEPESNSGVVVAIETEEEAREVLLSSMPKTLDTIDIEGSEGEEIVDSPDGAGETTLDVPILGNMKQKEEKTFNWLIYFIAGTAVGATSTLFLFSMFKRFKNGKRSL